MKKMINDQICEEMISDLRVKVISSMSEKRAIHTMAVESMAVRLGEIYAPDKLVILRSAALLHDVTKEKKLSEQMELCKKYGVDVGPDEILSPKTFHARTAAAMIPTEYPEFDDDEIIGAVRWHTTGRRGMKMTEKLIYLADYIDESRTFDDCVFLRNEFWKADLGRMSEKDKEDHLRDILILSYNMTIKNLLEENSPIASDTFDARNELICEKLKANISKG